jgi:hypothetical protein
MCLLGGDGFVENTQTLCHGLQLRCWHHIKLWDHQPPTSCHTKFEEADGVYDVVLRYSVLLEAEELVSSEICIVSNK